MIGPGEDGQPLVKHGDKVGRVAHVSLSVNAHPFAG